MPAIAEVQRGGQLPVSGGDRVAEPRQAAGGADQQPDADGLASGADNHDAIADIAGHGAFDPDRVEITGGE